MVSRFLDITSPDLRRPGGLLDWINDKYGDNPEIFYDSNEWNSEMQALVGKMIDDKKMDPSARDKHTLTKYQKDLRYWLQEESGFDLDDAGNVILREIRSASDDNLIDVYGALDETEIAKKIFQAHFGEKQTNDLLTKFSDPTSGFVLRNEINKRIEGIKETINLELAKSFDFNKIADTWKEDMRGVPDSVLKEVGPLVKIDVIKEKLRKQAGLTPLQLEKSSVVKASLNKNTSRLYSEFKDMIESEREEQARQNIDLKDLEQTRRRIESEHVIMDVLRPDDFEKKMEEIRKENKNLFKVAAAYKGVKTKKIKKDIKTVLEEWW